MKRHANPDIPLPVLLVGAAAFGGAFVYWMTRPKANDVPATATQPLTVAENRPIYDRIGGVQTTPLTVVENRPIMGGVQNLPQYGTCPPGQEWGWGEGRGGNARCRLILSNEDRVQAELQYQALDSIANPQSMDKVPQIILHNVVLPPEEQARQVAEINLTPAQRAVFSSSLEALNKRTSQLQATGPDAVRQAARHGITERQVIEAARREYDSAYDEMLRQAAQLK